MVRIMGGEQHAQTGRRQRPDFPKLLPTCALLGGGYLLLIDTLARTLAPIEIPLGILTAVIGTPFFIWLLAGMQRNWS